MKDILKLKRQSIKARENTTLPYLPIDVIPMRTFALTDFKPNAEAQSSLITFDKDDIIIGAMRVYFHRVVLAPVMVLQEQPVSPLHHIIMNILVLHFYAVTKKTALIMLKVHQKVQLCRMPFGKEAWEIWK